MTTRRIEDMERGYGKGEEDEKDKNEEAVEEEDEGQGGGGRGAAGIFREDSKQSQHVKKQ